jgi:hypothetical protein
VSMRFSPDGTARMLTHGGSVADTRGAPTLRTDYGTRRFFKPRRYSLVYYY